MSEWDEIRGSRGWVKKLEELLQEAAKVAQNDDFHARMAVCDRLTDFIGHSPATHEIDKLDDLADKTAADLLEAEMMRRVAAIAGRTRELAQLTKKSESQAKTAKADAASIRLEKANEVVNALTEGVRALKGFLVALKTDETVDEKVAEKINRGVTTISNLRSAVEGLL
jgi:hypothetical protein